MTKNLSKWIILFLLASTTCFAQGAPNYAQGKSPPKIQQAAKELLAKYQDTSLLTLLEVKPWKAAPHLYVAFGCFAQDTFILHHYNLDYSKSQKKGFVLDSNCKVDRTYNPDESVAKNTALIVFDMDSLGQVQLVAGDTNVLHPWMFQDSTTEIPIDSSKYCWSDCNSESTLPKNHFQEVYYEGPIGHWSGNPFPDFVDLDQYSFEKLDLAPYVIGSQRAIGLRMWMGSNNAGGGFANVHSLVLLLLKDSTFQPIFALPMDYESDVSQLLESGMRDHSGESEEHILKIVPNPHSPWPYLDTYSKTYWTWSNAGYSKQNRSRLIQRYAYDESLQFYREAKQKSRSKRKTK